MTLIVTAHNDNRIAICADTLTTVEVDGAKQASVKSRKITKLNKGTALGMAGYFFNSSNQFITDFCHDNKDENDVLILTGKLLSKVKEEKPALDVRELLQITLVGFSNNDPQIIMVEIVPGKKPISRIITNNYFAIGFNGPTAMAYELLRIDNIESKPRTGVLKRIVKTAVKTCIREFTNSNNERLGGKANMVVLRKL
jgi:ATP-dependent protease HslVU (ClpYQ) peptidase subunit